MSHFGGWDCRTLPVTPVYRQLTVGLVAHFARPRGRPMAQSPKTHTATIEGPAMGGDGQCGGNEAVDRHDERPFADGLVLAREQTGRHDHHGDESRQTSAAVGCSGDRPQAHRHGWTKGSEVPRSRGRRSPPNARTYSPGACPQGAGERRGGRVSPKARPGLRRHVGDGARGQGQLTGWRWWALGPLVVCETWRRG